MLGHVHYGKIMQFDVKVINKLTAYETYSYRKNLPENTTLWDLYMRYALEDITGVSPDTKKQCLTLTHYRSFNYNRLRFFQSATIYERVQMVL